MNPTFWGRRFSVGPLVTVAIVIVAIWFPLSFIGRTSPRFLFWVSSPFRKGLADAMNALDFSMLGLVGISDPQALYDYWTAGPGLNTALVLPALLIALLLWLLGLDIVQMLIGGSPSVPHGAGRFASAREEAFHRRYKPGALNVGAGPGSSSYWFSGPEHLLTVAPTRSGKGVGVIVPNLLTAERSVLVIDPKGENAEVTARHRQSFGPVHVLAPFRQDGVASAGYNPLAGLDPKDDAFVDDAATLAAALIVSTPNADNPHFDEGARALLRGLLMLVVVAEPPERRNLVTLREYLTYPRARFDHLLQIMAETRDGAGAITSVANVFAAKNDKERAAILSTAQEQTNFLESPAIQRSITRSDFEFASLKTGIATVYLVLPQERMESHGRWIRLLVTRALQDIQRTKVKPAKPAAPILFVLDEFAALGDMPAIKTAIGLMAGYGLQIWAFLQNWGQLEEVYGKGAHTFAANAGVFQAFRVNDTVTARYVSDLSGDTARHQPADQGKPVGGKLLTPEEVMHLGDDRMFLKFKGTRPILAGKRPYFQDRKLRKIADPSSLHAG
ncbi:type IV secretory system conjugative DNA transfer family protein [Aureimonas pseudogalii]|uniref:Type IV secretion system protein VirD4 n=1 Tax=Aureimonas pseudogalii TaxID=1744844 RepID=A0A7W6MM66_9HYPH|nr:type IV secretory system conjugative DNA transfer family protein [Aureimonas pseudogalii]MBB4000495.1 type IV secretion system protein VirD4 [Aureimonas pseudogalii]